MEENLNFPDLSAWIIHWVNRLHTKQVSSIKIMIFSSILSEYQFSVIKIRKISLNCGWVVVANFTQSQFTNMKISFLFLSFILIAQLVFSQADSSQCDCKNGKFHMIINKGKIEFIPGIYRSRVGTNPNGFGLNNQNITLNFYFPFSHVLQKNGSKTNLMKMNVLSFIHISNKGNYGLGFASKTRWLIIKNLSLAYQGGFGWFDTNDNQASDGLNHRGFNFHHIFSIIQPIHPKWEASLNFLHVSNGGLLGKNENSNVQDVMGLGISYQF